MLDLEKIKIVFLSERDDLGITGTSGVSLLDLFPGLLGDLMELFCQISSYFKVFSNLNDSGILNAPFWGY